MPPLLELVRNQPDPETLKAVADLAAKVKTGEIVGLFYIALHSGPGYTGDVVGRAKRLPAYTAGLALALQNKLITLIR